MMWSAFTSEWTKLRRPTLFYSTFLGLAAAASLFVVLMFSQARENSGIVTLHQLARPNGLVIGVARASMLLGVVAFGIAAAQVASESSLGTLRQLLVRQPRRTVLLGGKMLGTVTFLIGAVLRGGRRPDRGGARRRKPARPGARLVHRCWIGGPVPRTR